MPSVIWLCSLVTVLLAPLFVCDVPPSHNHGPIVMGVPNDQCDNAEVSCARFVNCTDFAVASADSLPGIPT